MSKNTNKERTCECGGDRFIGHESNVVRGFFDDGGVLLLKSHDALGIEDLRCENCNKLLKEDFEIEFV